MKGVYLEALSAIKTTLTLAKDAEVPILTTITGVLLHLITAVEASQANKEQIRDLTDRLRRLVEAVIQPILSTKRDTGDSDGVIHSFNRSSPYLEDRIGRLSTKLTTLRDEIFELDSRNAFRRMIAHNIVSDALAAASRKIGEAVDDFLVEGDITKEMMILDTQQSVIWSFEQTKEGLVDVKAELIDIKEELVDVKGGLAGIGDELMGVKEELVGVNEGLVGIGDELVGVNEGLMGISDELSGVNEKLDIMVAQNNNRMSTEDIGRLIDGLPHAQAHFNAESKGNSSSCWPGTRLQLLEEVQNWEVDDGDDCPRVFWLTGLAGAGKTTIARTVASTLDKAGRLGGSFFFSRLEGGDRAEAKSLFTTIAWQLARFHPSFRTSIAQSLEKNPTSVHNNTASQLKALITTPFSRAVDPPACVTIVIDALDECSTDDPQLVEEILELLLTVPRFSFQVKFFLTSRPEYHIRDHLLSNIHVRPLILQRISPSIVQGDIGLLLRESLQKIGRTRLRDECWPNEEDLEALIKMSGELFIFASTAIKYIQGDRYRRNPKQNLETLLRSQQDDAKSRPKGIRSPYHDIDQLYLQVLRDSVPEDADMEDSAFIRDIVGTIILLRQPLSVIAISYLICVDIDKVASDLELLFSVIDVPEDNSQPITIIHPSFVDFLTSPERCIDPRFFIDRNVHESRLAELCLDHIRNSLSTTTVGDCHGETLANLVQTHGGLGPTTQILANRNALQWHPPQMQYVCVFWDTHLRALETPPDLDLTEKMRYFWSTMLVEWVRHHIVMEPQSLMKFSGMVESLTKHRDQLEQLEQLEQEENLQLERSQQEEQEKLQEEHQEHQIWRWLQQERQERQERKKRQKRQALPRFQQSQRTQQMQRARQQIQQVCQQMQQELRDRLLDVAMCIHSSSSQELSAIRSADFIQLQLIGEDSGNLDLLSMELPVEDLCPK